MDELSILLSAHGIPSLLKYSHAIISLICMDGTIIECNAACDMLRNTNPASDSIPSLLTLESRALFERLILLSIEKNAPVHGTLTLAPIPGSDGIDYDCVFIPLPVGRFLFLAERVTCDTSLAERYQGMSRHAAQLKLDLEQTRQCLLKKQKEIDLVVAQAREVANTDALTFLPNRRQIIGDLQREVMNSDCHRSPLSISMLDIDHFKNINDTYGHAIGDLVLRQTASHMREHIQAADLVGRYGGEEFLVIQPNTDLTAATAQAAHLCARIRVMTTPVGDEAIRVTVSIGVAQYRIGREDWQRLLARADSALYDAKAAGRDQCAAACA